MSEPMFAIDVDVAPVVAAVRHYGDVLQRHINDASRVTATQVVREARARLGRQIAPRSTQRNPRHQSSVDSILAEPAYDGDGWIVAYENPEMPNLGLWLEKGTKAGKRHNYARTQARPFFYSSIELEVGAHERRIEDAVRSAANELGLGD